MKKCWLSVIIPALNEEKTIGACLEALEKTEAPGTVEVIVVDGGSRDGTTGIASSFPGAKIATSPPGRGIQMNRGAREATGEVLLFLHADVILPPKTDSLIRHGLAKPGAIGGWFKVRTIVSPERGWVFRSLISTANWRSHFGRYPYGDQAVFVKRNVFEKLRGFRDIPIMEDIEFSRRLRREGTLVKVDAYVKVSGRRWEKNIVRNVLKLKLLPLLYRLGVSPTTLARFYGEVR